MLYRVAIQTNTVPPSWQWKSTPLSSLNAVLRFLQLYRALPQDRLRVFASDSRDGLGEQFRREQDGLRMHSVTATQFLRERLISTGEAIQETLDQKAHQNREAVSSGVVNSLTGCRGSIRAPAQDGICLLDYRRLEIERGAGGDHDLPYHFAFPHVWPQAHAWIRLLVEVQRGELQPQGDMIEQ
jgi:hypothetical protein